MSKEVETAGMPPIYDELRPLFFPDSVCVVGVSQHLWKAGSFMVRALQTFGYPGKIYPVGGRSGEMLGLQVYESIESLPESPDVAMIFVPGAALTQVVQECKAKGIKALMAFTGGFSETLTDEGRALEAELVKEFDGTFRMLGPNCLGYYCPAGKVTQFPGEGYSPIPGDVAFFAQSGGISLDFARSTSGNGIHASKVVSYGNACNLNEADFLEYFEADPDTNIISMYMEGARDLPRFARILKRTTLKKPVLVWKGGLTPPGAPAALRHTASVAGTAEEWEPLLRENGAIKMLNLPEVMDTAAAFHFYPDLVGDRVGCICGGGGNSCCASDAAYRVGLTVPEWTPETREKVQAFLPPVGANASNPVDTSRFLPAPTIKGMLETMAASGEIDAIIVDQVIMSPELRRLMHYADQSPMPQEPWLSDILVDIQKTYGIPCLLVMPENLDPLLQPVVEEERLRLRHYYHENGVAVYPTIDRAFRALGHVVDHNRRVAELTGK